MRLPIPQSDVSIVGKDGRVAKTKAAIAGSELAIIDDTKSKSKLGMKSGVYLPNGMEEAFTVVDPTFYDKIAGLDAHYSVKMVRKGAYPCSDWR